MKFYELTYLISPDLSEDASRDFSQKVKGFIQEKGGLLESSSEKTLAKKKIGYPIKNKVEGYLASLDFSLEPERLADLEKQLKSETPILRYLLLTKKPLPILKERVTPRGISSLPKKISKPKPKEKVELKEIEEKLDEILGQ